MSGLLVWLPQPMATWPCCPGPVVKQPIVEGIYDGVQLFTAREKGL